MLLFYVFLSLKMKLYRNYIFLIYLPFYSLTFSKPAIQQYYPKLLPNQQKQYRSGCIYRYLTSALNTQSSLPLNSKWHTPQQNVKYATYTTYFIPNLMFLFSSSIFFRIRIDAINILFIKIILQPPHRPCY